MSPSRKAFSRISFFLQHSIVSRIPFSYPMPDVRITVPVSHFIKETPIANSQQLAIIVPHCSCLFLNCSSPFLPDLRSDSNCSSLFFFTRNNSPNVLPPPMERCTCQVRFTSPQSPYPQDPVRHPPITGRPELIPPSNPNFHLPIPIT